MALQKWSMQSFPKRAPIQPRVFCTAASIFSLSPASSYLSALLVQSVRRWTSNLPTVLGLNLDLVGFAFSTGLFCFLRHAVDLILQQAVLLVGTADLIGLACGLSSALMLRASLASMSQVAQSLASLRGAGRVPSMELTEKVVTLGRRRSPSEILMSSMSLVITP